MEPLNLAHGAGSSVHICAQQQGSVSEPALVQRGPDDFKSTSAVGRTACTYARAREFHPCHHCFPQPLIPQLQHRCSFYPKGSGVRASQLPAVPMWQLEGRGTVVKSSSHTDTLQMLVPGQLSIRWKLHPYHGWGAESWEKQWQHR